MSVRSPSLLLHCGNNKVNSDSFLGVRLMQHSSLSLHLFLCHGFFIIVTFSSALAFLFFLLFPYGSHSPLFEFFSLSWLFSSAPLPWLSVVLSLILYMVMGAQPSCFSTNWLCTHWLSLCRKVICQSRAQLWCSIWVLNILVHRIASMWTHRYVTDVIC